MAERPWVKLRLGGSPTSRTAHRLSSSGEVFPLAPVHPRPRAARRRWSRLSGTVPFLSLFLARHRRSTTRHDSGGRATSNSGGSSAVGASVKEAAPRPSSPVPSGSAVTGERRSVTPRGPASATPGGRERRGRTASVPPIDATMDGLWICGCWWHPAAAAQPPPFETAQRSYHGRVLCCLLPSSRIRRAFIRLIEWPWFDRAVLVLICVNCAFLAVQQPWEEPQAWWAVAEFAFQVLFTLELVCKVIALGFVLPRGSYLRDGWNWVDLIVVVVGWLAFLPRFQNVSAIRSVRVFRPLRTITRIRGMRLIVASLIDSIPMMANVLLLFLFAIFLFGVVGVQLFRGDLRFRCFDHAGAAEAVADDAVCFCNLDDMPWAQVPSVCPDDRVGFYSCPQGQVCARAATNPNHGVTSFDHLGDAVYNVFQALTLEGWIDLTYMLMAGHSPVMAVLYMVLLVGFLAFFVVNLFLAVIFLSFEDTRKSEAPADEAAAAEEQWRRDAQDAQDHAASAALSGCRGLCRRVITHAWFTNGVTALIIVNTALMACEFHGMPSALSHALEVSNWILTGLFAAELIVKVVGLGLREYVADRFNIFDAAIVIISVVEIALTVAAVNVPGNLSVLRAFRLMRVFKLARSWAGLQQVLSTVLGSLNSIAYLAGILLLIMFIFALLGMQVFGTIFGDPSIPDVLEQTPRTNFNNLGWAMVTIFVVISGENWNEVFFDTIGALRALGRSSAPDLSVAYLYYVALVVIGNFVLINLFVAILLSNFESSGERSPERVRREAAKRVLNLIRRSVGTKTNDLRPDDSFSPDTTAAPAAASLAAPVAPNSGASDSAPAGALDAGLPPSRANAVGPLGPPPLFTRLPTRQSFGDVSVGRRSGSLSMGSDDMERSLCLFSATNPFRRAVVRLVRHDRFDQGVMGLIGVSSVLLILDSPFETDPRRIQALHVADVLFTALFALEMVLKVIAYGFFFTKHAYLRDPSNVLDFCIVAISVADLAIEETSGLSALKALRALRALRPLRLIARNSGMRVVIDVLYKSVPAVSNVCLIFLLFLLIFGILGVQLFGGRLGACSDPGVMTRASCVGEGPDGPRVWANPDVGNFDFIGNSTLLLFEMTTLEMWPDVMFATIDGHPSETDLGPRRDVNPLAALFSIAWIIVGAFFMLNLFVGVVIERFNRIKEEETGTVLLTTEQREWVEMNHMMLALRVPDRMLRPVEGPRHFLMVVVEHRAFEWAVACLILLNSAAIAMQHLGQPEEMTMALYYANYSFTAIFIAEAGLKIAAYGCREYFSDRWNCFDFALVLVSVVDVALDAASVDDSALDPVVLRIFRILRIARLLRLLRQFRKLTKLFRTLFLSAPALVNVGSLLLLLIVVYAIFGVQIFHSVRGTVEEIREGRTTDYEFINKWANFETFGVALLTLFRCATGESWNGLMHDCYRVSTSLSILFFVSYFLLCTVFMLNLFIAVILENFSDVAEEYEAPITPVHLRQFAEAWAEFDLRDKETGTKPSYTIASSHLTSLLMAVDPPLGLQGTEANRAEVLHRVRELGIPDHRGVVHMHETLYACAHRVCGVALSERDHRVHIGARVHRAFPSLVQLHDDRPADKDVAAFYAASYVQAAWRGFVARGPEESSWPRTLRTGEDRDRPAQGLARPGPALVPEALPRLEQGGAGRTIAVEGAPPFAASPAHKIVPVKNLPPVRTHPPHRFAGGTARVAPHPSWSQPAVHVGAAAGQGGVIVRTSRVVLRSRSAAQEPRPAELLGSASKGCYSSESGGPVRHGRLATGGNGNGNAHPPSSYGAGNGAYVNHRESR